MKVIVLRYSEIHLKGRNRHYFEGALINNLRIALSDFQYKLTRMPSRYIVSDYDEQLQGAIINRLEKVFGLYSLSVAYMVKSNIEDIAAACITLAKDSGTFKIVANRADKTFPLNSLQLNAELGGRVLDAHKRTSVNVHNPDWEIFVDVRENGQTLVYSQAVKCVNGMPVGTGGKGILLLSGGIDSPVAGYMMAKRGMSVRALHFHSYPFTSLIAKEKVLELAKVLKQYCLNITVDIVNVAEIQQAINASCPEGYMITILRRFMMRIADIQARYHKAGGIITGESLGQVASQTIESLTTTSAVTTYPILRPLIGFDKDEIIEIARRIGTFDLSIQPFEDCCTVFLPKSPAIHPKLKVVEAMEKALDVKGLIDKAIANIETITL